MDAWDPQKDDYFDPYFNSYNRGQGRNLPRHAQVSTTRQAVSLYVAGIPREIDESGLMNMFSKAGNVKHVKKLHPLEGKPDTVGFVTMGSVREAEAAMYMFNHFPINNHTLRVDVALNDEEKRNRELKKQEDEEFFSYLSQSRENNAKPETGKSLDVSDSEELKRSTINSADRMQQHPSGLIGAGRGKVLSQIIGPAGDLAKEDPALLHVGRALPTTDNSESVRMQNLSIAIDESGDNRVKVQDKHDKSVKKGNQRKTGSGLLATPDLNRRGQQGSYPAGRGYPGQGMGRGFPRDRMGDGYPGDGMGRGYPGDGMGPGYHLGGHGGGYPGNRMGHGYPGDRIGHGYHGDRIGHGYHGDRMGLDYPGDGLGRGHPRMMEETGYGRDPQSRFIGRGGPFMGRDMDMMYHRPYQREPYSAATYDRSYHRADPYAPEYNRSGYPPDPYLLQPSYDQRLNKTALEEDLNDTLSICSVRQEPRSCNLCGTMGSRRCSQCKTPYCCQECQRRDWSNHKLLCKQIREGNEAADQFESRFDLSVGDEMINGVKDVVERYSGDVEVIKKPQKNGGASSYEGLAVAVTGNNKKNQQTKSHSSAKGAANKKESQPREYTVKDKGMQPGSYKQGHPKQKTESTPKSQRAATTEQSASGTKGSPQKPVRVAPPLKPPSKSRLELNKPTQVAVCEVCSPGQIWVQKFSEENSLLEETMRTLANKYCESKPELDKQSVRVGEYYAALFSEDKMWYRAQVDHLTAPDTVTVTFIDFGNKETMTLSRLRTMDQSMMACPQQAIECCLTGVVSPDGKDTPSVWKGAISRYQEHIHLNEEYTVVANQQKDDTYLVSFTDTKGNDVSEKLVKAGLAVFSAKRSSQMSQRLESVADQLKVGQEVKVVFMEASSPQDLSVQLVDADVIQSFQEFDKELNQLYQLNKGTVYKPQKDEIVVALFGDDGKWYRAQVLELGQSDAALRYVDYGNKDRQKFSAIRAASDGVFAVPKQAMQCCLWGLESPAHTEWPKGCLEIFAKEVHEKVLSADVKAVSNGVVNLDLKSAKSGVSISSLLMTSEPAQESTDQASRSPGDGGEMIPPQTVDTEKLPLDGTILKVELTHFVNLGSIYFQVSTPEAIKSLNSLMKKVADYCSLAETLYVPSAGELVCAQFSEDQKWYRAMVQYVISKTMFHVIFIDFGNEEDVTAEHIRKFDPSLEGPGKGIHCQLEGVEKSTYSSKVQLFVNCISCSSLRIKGKQFLDRYHTVELYTDDGVCVNTRLGLKVSAAKDLKESGIKTPERQASEVSGQSKPEPSSPKAAGSRETVSSRLQESFKLPQDGSVVPVELTHLGNLADFYVHISTPEFQESLAVLMKRVSETCTDSSPYRPAVGEIVGALFSVDNVWYRAKVLEIVNGEKFHVIFIDFGNDEELTEKSIRALEQSLHSKGKADHCRLEGVTNPTDTNKISSFAKMCQGKALNIKAKACIEELYDVELFTGDGACINTELEPETTVGSAVPKEEPKTVTVIEKDKDKPAQSSKTAQPQVSSSNSLSLPLDGSWVECVIQEVVGLDSFYIQLAEATLQQMFALLMTEIAKYCSSERVPYKPAVGEVVCAKFTEDQMWYRAQVMKVLGDNVYIVFFLDYGNTEMAEGTDMRKMLPRFYEEPFMAIQCKLAGATEKKEEQKVVALKAKVQIKLRARAMKVDHGSHVIQLMEGTKSINGELGLLAETEPLHARESSSRSEDLRRSSAAAVPEKCLLEQQEPVALVEGKSGDLLSSSFPSDLSSVEAEITYINGLSSFYMQLKGKDLKEKFNAMRIEIHRYCSSENTVHKPGKGELVFAQYDADDAWYRARIQAVEDSKSTVYFIDYGNVETIGMANIRKLDVSRFLDLPQMAIHCRLAGLTEDVSEDALGHFLKFIQETQMQFKTKSVQCADGIHDVLLYMPKGRCVNNALGLVSESEVPSPSDSISVGCKDLPVVSLPCDGTAVEMKVTHAVGADNFYLQPASEVEQTKLSEMMYALNQYCASHGNPFKPSPGQIVCALFSQDMRWYRAQCEVEKEGQYHVTFIDYGNDEIVTVENIRQLDNQFRSVPKMAVHCKLDGFTGTSQDMLREFALFLQKSNGVCITKVAKIDSDLHHVQLFLSDETCVNIELGCNIVAMKPRKTESTVLNDNLSPQPSAARPDRSSLSPQGLLAETEPLHARESSSRSEDLRRSSAAAAPEKCLLEQQEPVALVEGKSGDLLSSSFPSDLSSVEAEITYINGLSSFYMQLKGKDLKEKFNAMRKEIHRYCSSENTVHKPGIGELVFAQYDADDAWYRARVQAVEDSKSTVYFIDYGNVETIGMANIRKLDVSRFLDLPQMAIHCRLAGLTEDVPEDALGHFLKFIQETQMQLKSKSVQCADGIHDVLLYMPKGRCVNNALGLVSESEVPSPSDSISVGCKDLPVVSLPCDGTAVEMKVTHAVGADNFYLQPASEVEQTKLSEMMYALNQYCASHGSPFKPSPGQIVCALFSQDMRWYRAQCEVEKEGQYQVTFIDYGNDEIVTVENIRQLDNQFRSVPKMAVHCKLDGFTGTSQDMLREFALFLQKSNGVCITKVAKIDSDLHHVQLFLSDETCVNIELGCNIVAMKPRKTESTVLNDNLSPQPSAARPDRSSLSPQGQGTERKVILANTVEHFRPTENRFQVIVTNASSPGLFHCQIPSQEATEKLVLLTHSLGLEGLGQVDLPRFNTDYKVGELCCAKFSGGEWYRASIQKVFPDQTAEVEFVDFGNHEMVSLQSMRPILDEHLKLPILAFKCCLAGVKPADKDWTLEACRKMQQYENEPLMAELVEIKDGFHHLKLTYSSDGQRFDVAQVLLKMKLASDPTVSPPRQHSPALPSATVTSADVRESSSSSSTRHEEEDEELDEKERLRRANQKLQQEMDQMRVMMEEMKKGKQT